MDNQKAKFKFSKTATKPQVTDKETKDNFNVTELVKYYNEFVIKQNSKFINHKKLKKK